MIADHGRTWFQEESPVQYIVPHWMEAEGGRIYSRYPPGLPFIIALTFKLFGPHAGILVNYILTTLTLLDLFLLCSMWIGKGWALAATVAMVFNPITNCDAMIGDSHIAVACFMIWGIYFLARWSKSMSLGSAFISGFFLGFIPTIRYPEALFGLGIVLFILFHVKKDKKGLPSAAAAVIGAMIPISCLMVHNYIAFGAVGKTAYSLTKEQTGFWGQKIISKRWKKTATTLAITLMVVNAFWGAPQLMLSTIILKNANASLVAVKKVVTENVKPGDVVIAPSHIQQYLDYIGRWRLLDNTVIEGLPMPPPFLPGAGNIDRGGRSKGFSKPPMFLNHVKEADMPMAGFQHIKRKMKMFAYMASIRGCVSSELLNEIDRWNNHSGEIYWIGRIEEIKNKVPEKDKIMVVKKIEPPQQLKNAMGKNRLPLLPRSLNRIISRHIDNPFDPNPNIPDPRGIIRLMQKDGGLELVKWTRSKGEPGKEDY